MSRALKAFVISAVLVLALLPARLCAQATPSAETTPAIQPSDSAGMPADTQPKSTISKPDRTPLILMGAALAALPADTELFGAVRRTVGTEKSGFYDTVNSLGDGRTLIALLGGMYLLGGRKDKDTATLAFAALVNTGIQTEGLKRLTGRARPGMDDGGDFEGPRISQGYTSFPSGHTGAAFAVATVLAKRHPKQKWLYYGLASAVGLTRIQKGAHFPGDVLAGAAIGIYTGNWTVKHGPRLIEIRF